MLERGVQSSSFQAQKSHYPSKLNDGQVIYAKINKVLPEGMAEINYKGQKMIAKLEAPLVAGNHYIFQTELGDEGVLNLKVISTLQGEVKSSFSDIAEKLMSDLQLPKGGNIKELVTLMVKNSLPFSKGELIRMNALLADSSDKQEGIQTLLKLKGAGLTITRPLYLSHLYGKNMESVSELLNRLEAALKKNTSLPVESKGIFKVLTEVKESENTKLFQKVVKNTFSLVMDNREDLTTRSSALKLLQMLGVVSESVSLERAASLSGETSKPSGQAGQGGIAGGAAPIKDKLVVLSELLSKMKSPDEKGQLLFKEVQSVLKSMETGGRDSQELIKTGAELIRRGEAVFSEKGMTQLTDTEKFNLNNGIHSRKEQQGLNRFLSMIEQLNQNRPPEQPAMKLLQKMMVIDEGNAARIHIESLPEIIKDLISKLGLNQEAKLAAGFAGERSLNDSLKPSLIALLKDLPQGETRDAAERLLYKLNGHAVLSGENGPLQHVVYQLPLSWLNQRTDLTMQWTGRKTDKGKIDSEYCRVLFYLELKSIKEVIVDMTVQNRSITLNIYNDTPKLKELSGPFSLNMKEGLEKLGYKLSSVNFKESGTSAPVKERYRELAGEVPYSGVDLKI
ncbi:hypothetical protein [Bacillus sp. P14.5]|uniref:hypothetical protein n=1 Tax=Bacillus sp. P14.5 TaxID=1983400 RepID=UPI000DE9D2D0|nr:hypothetical protein [Bacillus sp. P14.5]